MPDLNIIIPGNIDEHLQGRRIIWGRYESAIKMVSQINQLSGQIDQNVTAAQLDLPLANPDVPLNEIGGSLQKLQDELGKIKRAESEINGYYREIESLKQRLVQFKIGTVVGGVILLWILANLIGII